MVVRKYIVVNTLPDDTDCAHCVFDSRCVVPCGLASGTHYEVNPEYKE